MESKGTAIRIKQTVEIAERVDGQVIATDSPVPCDCCGKLCIVRYYEMTNGAKLGKECATVIDLTFAHSQYNPEKRTEIAIMMRANKKHLAYIAREA